MNLIESERIIGKVCVNLGQASIIAAFIKQEIEVDFPFVAYSVVFLVFGIICQQHSHNREAKQGMSSHSRKHRIKLAKNTTLTVEVEK